jgi:uncharacterized membrane protein (DUF485 family)
MESQDDLVSYSEFGNQHRNFVVKIRVCFIKFYFITLIASMGARGSVVG